MSQKRIEKRCLHITKSNLQWLRKYHNISKENQERPDFILSDGNERLGVEHFLVDTLWNGGSQSRKSGNSISALNKQCKDKNIEGNEVEIVGRLTDAVGAYFDAYEHFDYDTFINNFRRIFNKHLSNVDVYKKNDIDKIGFLIEISVLDFEYDIIETNGDEAKKHIRGIPFTEDMWKIINHFDKLDFVIITVLKVNSNKNKSYYFDKAHCPQNLCKNFKFIIK